MSTCELLINKTFYPSPIVQQAIEDFKDEVLIEQQDIGSHTRLLFSHHNSNIKEEFANYCLGLYKHGIDQ